MLCALCAVQETNITYTLKCNIDENVSYLHQGITLGMKEDREKNSAKLDKLVMFTGAAKIAALPPYLTVQMVRFFYKRSAQQKAKILKKVNDMHDVLTCTCAPVKLVLATCLLLCNVAMVEGTHVRTYLGMAALSAGSKLQQHQELPFWPCAVVFLVDFATAACCRLEAKVRHDTSFGFESQTHTQIHTQTHTCK